MDIPATNLDAGAVNARIQTGEDRQHPVALRVQGGQLGSERGLAAWILQLHADDCFAVLLDGMCPYSQALWSQ